MSINLTDEISRVEDFFSARSVLSNGSISLESLAGSNTDTHDLFQRIILLHDKRYDASCKLSQCRFKFNEIDQRQTYLITKSTLQQETIQKESDPVEDRLNVLLEEGNKKLSIITNELSEIKAEVEGERDKLTELEDQIEMMKHKLDLKRDVEIPPDELDLMKDQLSVLEDQYEQKNKEFEDLEFKLLELEAKKEDDKAIIQHQMIEEQKHFLDSTRDQKIHDQIFDERKLESMATRRKEFDRLESDRNACHQQILHYEGIVQNCKSKIEQLTNQLDSDEFEELMLRYQQPVSNPGYISPPPVSNYSCNGTTSAISNSSTSRSTVISPVTSFNSYSESSTNPQVSTIMTAPTSNSITQNHEQSLEELKIQQNLLQEQLSVLTRFIQSQCYNNNNNFHTPDSSISTGPNCGPVGSSLFSIIESTSNELGQMILNNQNNSHLINTPQNKNVTLTNITPNNNCNNSNSTEAIQFKYPSTHQLHHSSSSTTGEIAELDGSLCSTPSPLPITSDSSLNVHSTGNGNIVNFSKPNKLNSTVNTTDSSDSCSVVTRRSKRHKQNVPKQTRPLTCFLPKLEPHFNLRRHIESCGHNLPLLATPVSNVNDANEHSNRSTKNNNNLLIINESTCQGWLWLYSVCSGKLMFRRNKWKRRWVYFNHTDRQITFYKSKTKNKVKGVIEFKDIVDVFIDHANMIPATSYTDSSVNLDSSTISATPSSSSSRKQCFCIETLSSSSSSSNSMSTQKTYSLMTPRSELVSLWVDVIFTGAEGYLRLHHPSMLNSITNSCYLEQE